MILDYHESRLKRKCKAALTKPHQPFFLLGITVALLSIAVLGFALKGTFALDIKTYHALNMAIVMPTALFLGFLITVLYRFLLVMPFLQKEYMRIFAALLIGALLCQIGFFVSEAVIFVGVLSVLIAHILAMRMFVKAYKKSNIEDKREVFWILLAFGFAAPGCLLFAASIFYPALLPLAVNISFYPFAVGMVFAIAQKMVPNFFILYYGVMQPSKNNSLLPIILLCLFMIAVSRSFDIPLLSFVANLLGLAATATLFWINRFVFRKAPAILWVLQIGALWFFAGFAVGVSESLLSSVPHLLQVHIWGIGFIVTMIIGFGSRVAMGHSGRKIDADKTTVFIFVTLVFLVFVRLLGVFYPTLLEASIYLWCFIFTVWAYKYAPMLVSD